MRNTIFLLFLIAPTFLFSQIQDTTFALDLIERAKAKQNRKGCDSALILVNQALDIFEKTGIKSHKGIGDIYFIKGKCLGYKDYFQKAIENYEKAEKIYVEIESEDYKGLVSLWGNMGGHYGNMGEYEIERDYRRKALDLNLKLYGNNHQKTAKSYARLGNAYLLLNEVDIAMDCFEKTEKIYLNDLENNELELAGLYNSIGLAWKKRGFYEKALSYYFKGLPVAKKYAASKRHYLTLLQNIGIAYKNMNEHELAIKYTMEGIESGKKLFKSDFYRGMDGAVRNLGNIYLRKKDYSKALEVFMEGLETYQKSRNPVPFRAAFFEYSIAQVFHKMTHYDEAIDYYKKCMITSNILDDPTTWVALARPHLRMGNFDNARKYYQKTLDTLNFLNAEKQYSNHRDVLAALVGMAQTWHEEFKISGDNSKLWRAEAWYDLYLKKSNDYVSEFFTDSGQTYWVNLHGGFAKMATVMKTDLFMATDSSIHFENAFEVAESSKNFTLKKALRAQNFQNFDNKWVNNERDFNNKISKKEEMLFSFKKDEENNVNSIEKLRSEIFDLKSDYQAFLAKMKTENAAFYNLKFEDNTISLSQIQNEVLAPNHALIKYVWSDTTLLTFVIQKEKTGIHKTILPVDFQEVIFDFKNNLTNQELILNHPDSAKSLFCKNAYLLYKTLLQKSLENLSSKVEKLIIIPDGALGFIPFEMLLTNESCEKPYAELPYLIRDYSLSYASSATLLWEQKQIENQSKKLFAGFAASYDKEAIAEADTIADNILAMLVRDGEMPLPGALDEVREIAELIEGKAFLAEEASEDNFNNLANQFRILHFSMHALPNDDNPLYSKLLFTKTNDTLNDNFLHAAELYNTQLNAELAVLSACNTGYGKLNQGEGIMSLSRAFAYCGVPSTVMSLWKVPDNATSEIMVNFYKNLKKGETKDLALRNAKINYLNAIIAPEMAHPFYWAGFVASGDMEMIDFSKSPSFLWLGIFVLIILIGGLFLKSIR